MKNKYGYQIDISKPKYRGLYDRYKKWKGIPVWMPLSDKERFEFEDYVLNQRGERCVENTKTEKM